MSAEDHRRKSENLSVRCAVITLSDTRTQENDGSGAAIGRMLVESGNEVASYQVIKDEPKLLRVALEQLLADTRIDAIITNGGTGLSKRDQTVGVIQGLIETPLPGFGELFRMLSFQEIGPAAMLSRALAGIVRAKVIFSLPGSTPAVELAMNRLILPELRHLVGQLRT